MKQRATSKERVGESLENCANCGEKTMNGLYCSRYCQEDMTFRLTAEERYE